MGIGGGVWLKERTERGLWSREGIDRDGRLPIYTNGYIQSMNALTCWSWGRSRRGTSRAASPRTPPARPRRWSWTPPVVVWCHVCLFEGVGGGGLSRSVDGWCGSRRYPFHPHNHTPTAPTVLAVRVKSPRLRVSSMTSPPLPSARAAMSVPSLEPTTTVPSGRTVMPTCVVL